MKQCINNIWAGGLGLLFMMTACNSGMDETTGLSDKDVMTFEALHPDSPSRVTDTGFEANDCVGLYLTTKDTPLELSGNYVNNTQLTYSSNAWSSAKPIYWNEGNYDIYAYFPYVKSLSSVDDMPLSVSTEQHVAANYAASDFLWAGKKDVEASDGKITLQFEHRMSRLVIKLTKGEDYEGDLPEDAEVYIHNTVTEATADLSVGIVTRNPRGTAETIRAKSLGNHRYAAIVVPQRLNNRQPLVEVIMKGVSYLYESKFLFKPGVQHNVLLAVSKNPEQVKIEVGGEIEDWD